MEFLPDEQGNNNILLFSIELASKSRKQATTEIKTLSRTFIP